MPPKKSQNPFLPNLTAAQKAKDTRTKKKAAQQAEDQQHAAEELPPRRTKVNAQAAWASMIPGTRKRASSTDQVSEKSKVARKTGHLDVQGSESKEDFSDQMKGGSGSTQRSRRYIPADIDSDMNNDTNPSAGQKGASPGSTLKNPGALAKAPAKVVDTTPEPPVKATAKVRKAKPSTAKTQDSEVSSSDDDQEPRTSDDELDNDGSDLEGLSYNATAKRITQETAVWQPSTALSSSRNEDDGRQTRDDDVDMAAPEAGFTYDHEVAVKTDDLLDFDDEVPDKRKNREDFEYEANHPTRYHDTSPSPMHEDFSSSRRGRSLSRQSDDPRRCRDNYSPPHRDESPRRHHNSPPQRRRDDSPQHHHDNAPQRHRGHSPQRRHDNALQHRRDNSPQHYRDFSHDRDVISRRRDLPLSHEDSPQRRDRNPSRVESSQVKKSTSKRQEKAEFETPRWQVKLESDNCHIGTMEQTRAAKVLTDDTERWPISTELVYNKRGRISLTQQSHDIQEFLQMAIKTFKGDILFVNAFPELGDRVKYTRDALFKSAKTLKLHYVQDRLKADKHYAKELAYIPDGRVSLLRGAFKDASVLAVAGQYGLTNGCAQKIADLKDDDVYIYPLDKSGKAITSQPFQHPAIIQVLHSLIFLGSPSLEAIYHDRFEVSPKGKVLVPPAMVALAAATIGGHALSEWSTGHHVPNAKFCAAITANEYRAHISLIHDIKQQSRTGYYNMLSRIYSAASDYESRPAATRGHGLALLDLAGLEQDSD